MEESDHKTKEGWQCVGEFLFGGIFEDETVFVVGLAILAAYVIGWILVMIVRSIIHDASSGGSGFQGLGLM